MKKIKLLPLAVCLLATNALFAQNALADHFVLKVKTTSANERFTFHTRDTSYDIDWDNDQTFDAIGVSGNQYYTNLNIKCRINKLNYFLSGLGKKYKHSHSYGSIF